MPVLGVDMLPPRNRPKHSRSFSDAKELQQLLMNAARNPDIKPVVLAALSRSYCELEECKRKLRMRPLPKAIDVSDKRKPKQSSSGIAPIQ